MILQKAKSFLLDQDYFILLPFLGLCLIGLTTIYSATATAGPEISQTFDKQVIFLGISLVLVLVIVLTPFGIIRNLSIGAYLASILFLALVLFLGVSRHGATRWFDLGIVFFQPSEMAKMTSIMMIAHLLSYFRIKTPPLQSILVAFGIAAIPPVLGTSVTGRSVNPRPPAANESAPRRPLRKPRDRDC